MRFMRYPFCGLLAAMLALPGATPASAEGIRLIRDAEIEKTVQLYAKPIFEAANLPEKNIRLYLVNSEQVNAFVSGGMQMFLNTGLIRRSQTPEQLMGVIAHEAGHIAGGHLVRFKDEIETRAAQNILTTALGTAAAVATGDVRIAQAVIFGGATVAERSLLQYSRTQESAADEAALRFLDRAEVSSRGLMEFLDILAGREAVAGGVDNLYQRTHPFTDERVRRVGEHLERSEWTDETVSEALYRRHARMLAKLDGFLDPPERTLERYAADDAGVPARYARAIAHYRIPDLAKALESIDGLIAEAPEDPYFRELRGQMLFENGRAAEALEAYREAVRLAPEAALIRTELGRAAIAVGTPEALAEAMRNLDEVVRSEPESAAGWRWLGMARGRAGEVVRADLAFAEHALLTGDVQRASALAKRARRKLAEGSPDHQRALDILHRIEPEKPQRG